MAISFDSGIDLDPAQGGSSGPILPGDLPANIDASKIGAGGVGNTEFGFLDGVTGSIQTQLNAKQAAFTGAPDGTKYAADNGTFKNLVPGDIPPVLILRAKKTGSQVCASNAWTRLTFDTPGRNDGALTVGGTGNATFTSTVAGWLQIDMTIYGPSSISGLLAAYKNGAYETRGTASIDIGGIRLSTGMIVGIGDTVEIYLNCSGGTITPNVSTEPQQYLQIACLGRA